MAELSFMILALLVAAVTPDLELPRLLPVHESLPMKMPAERLSAALHWGRQKVASYRALERAKSSSSSHYRRFDSAHPETQRRGREALAWVEAARAPANLTTWTAASREDNCRTPPECESSPRFRTQDGTCNNPDKPLLGAANTPLARLQPNTFDDSLNTPRTRGRGGDVLASARRISTVVTGNASFADRRLTLSLVNWGQFMDHDITLSPVFLTEEGEEIECCHEGMTVENAPPQCLPIEIPANDPFFAQFNQRCMPFVRSMPAMPLDCQSGRPTIAENVLTAFIDASNVYGSQRSRTSMLRTYSGGLLKTQGDNLLPPVPAGTTGEDLCFSDNMDTQPCFQAGDVRALEQSGLATIHTIWVREHNRLARRLARLNSHWNDERIFQEARRIVGAMLQHITYNEWLPVVLGDTFMRDNRIETLRRGFSKRYSPSVNPTISTEFSTAAYRFGHTMVQEQLELYEDLTSPPQASSRAVNLRDIFFDPMIIYDGRLDQLAIGMVTQPPRQFDTNLAEDVTEFLFRNDRQFGLDLVSLNIQRGRDHGIATYNTMRQFCGVGRAARFRDLLGEIPSAVISRLEMVYRHVDDIDLFIGLISEEPARGAVVGPTLQCIIGDQFIKLRWGDNFFYDLGHGRPWQFTSRQLKELRKVTWARVLCDNIPSIKRIQPSAFLAPNDGNMVTRCRRLPKLNLRRWRNRH